MDLYAALTVFGIAVNQSCHFSGTRFCLASCKLISDHFDPFCSFSHSGTSRIILSPPDPIGQSVRWLSRRVMVDKPYMLSRKPHRKSRLGCGNCKRRRVKVSSSRSLSHVSFHLYILIDLKSVTKPNLLVEDALVTQSRAIM